ncbi:copper amine oxidase N-terminal domain-containing protein [Desulfoscipio gibsoniae]
MRVVDDLIGADVVFNQETKTAEITFSGQEVKFTADSNKVIINNTPSSMNTKVVYDEKINTLFIPVYILINTFNLNAQWNPTWNQLDINDERIMKGQEISDLEGSNVWRNKVSNANAFRMVHFALRKIHEEEMFTRMQLEFTAENITEYDIQEGEEDIHYWIKLNNSFIAETDTRDQRPRPYVKVGEITKRGIPFDINKGDALNYVMIWPRTVLPNESPKINTNLAPEDAAKLNEILNHSAKYINEVANGHLSGDPDLALNANKVCVQEDYETFQEPFDMEELKELDEAFETAIYNMEADCSKDGRMIYRDNYKEKLRQVLKTFEKYTS